MTAATLRIHWRNCQSESKVICWHSWCKASCNWTSSYTGRSIFLIIHPRMSPMYSTERLAGHGHVVVASFCKKSITAKEQWGLALSPMNIGHVRSEWLSKCGTPPLSKMWKTWSKMDAELPTANKQSLKKWINTRTCFWLTDWHQHGVNSPQGLSWQAYMSSWMLNRTTTGYQLAVLSLTDGNYMPEVGILTVSSDFLYILTVQCYLVFKL